jgi:hypothetical protein
MEAMHVAEAQAKDQADQEGPYTCSLIAIHSQGPAADFDFCSRQKGRGRA